MKPHYVSATLLTGATIALELERARAEAWLARKLGAAGARLGHAAADSVPLLIDLWQLHDGRLELNGRTQHEWLERIAAGWGGRVSRAGQRRFARYRETMFSLPGVYIGERGPYALVLGMFADSRAACLVDRGLRYGYHKRSARCEYQTFADASSYWQITDEAGTDVVRANLRVSDAAWRPAPALFQWACAQPLLGATALYEPHGPLGLRSSLVARDLTDHPCLELEGDVLLRCSDLELVPAGYHRWSKDSATQRAIHYRSLWARVTAASDL